MACGGQHDDMDLLVVIGCLDRKADLPRHVIVDGISRAGRSSVMRAMRPVTEYFRVASFLSLPLLLV